MNQNSQARPSWQGWKRESLEFAIVMVVAFGIMLLVQVSGCVDHTAFVAWAAALASVVALFSGLRLTNKEVMAVILVVLGLISAWGHHHRGQLPHWIPWIAALVLIPLAAFFAGRLIRKCRTLPSEN